MKHLPLILCITALSSSLIMGTYAIFTMDITWTNIFILGLSIVSGLFASHYFFSEYMADEKNEAFFEGVDYQKSKDTII